MKLYLKRISFLLLSLTLVLSACQEDDNFTATVPEAEFVLQNPSITNINLNFGLPTNPALTITWVDEVTGSSSYDIEMALDNTFSSTVNLGNVNSTSFSISVEDLNTAIRSTGVNPFKDITIYLKVNASGTESNSVSFMVTTYPIDGTQITSPSPNDAFVLSIGSLDEIAITVDWLDDVLTSDLEIDVDYTVEVAANGTNFATPVSIGSGTNISSLSITHSDLNAVAIGLGLAPEVLGDLDLRLRSVITNQGGSVLERISDVITISVTPFSLTFPFLYFVGDATTPGWNNNNNNTPVFRDQDVPNGYFFTGYFNAGAFKLLEILGEWQPQWGTNDGTTLAVNPGGGSDPGTFNVSSAGFYTYNFITVGESGTFTVTPFNASGATTYSTMGIIGQAIGGWGDGDEINFIQDINNPHLWYSLAVNFTNGEDFLIRANDMWDNVWRYTGSENLYGTAFLGSGNNFPFTGSTGNYDVWFNDLDGSYVIIPN